MYIWGMIVSRTIDLQDRFGSGTKYQNHTTGREIIIGMLSFVDDFNLSNNGEIYETLKDILNQTQSDVQF